ncbi:hypothetical protein RHMOL_Rhmol07G0277200 [Rhododendron molle]|uniref:Uncharacterized protein n=1 Tax=Rhododendron molle TaxID=49168 RepID=A0ACC0N6N6_RHOML|nr:hypothetical protein RHMOL_Rhmol07G0277200 [Rhododendron molle]
MERDESPRDNRDEQEGLLSCWGRLKLKFPWGRRRGRRRTRERRSVRWNIRVKDIFKSKRQRPAVGGYDPLSYAQNFDEGWEEDDEDYSNRGFSSRYAAPLKSVGSS